MIKSKAITALVTLWHKIARSREQHDNSTICGATVERVFVDESRKIVLNKTGKNRAKRQRKKSRKSFWTL